LAVRNEHLKQKKLFKKDVVSVFIFRYNINQTINSGMKAQK